MDSMSVVVIVWSMIAAACLTLASVHFPVWLRNREAQATLWFSVAAVASAAIACAELIMLKAQTPEVYAVAQRWFNVPAALLIIALVGFAYNYLQAGRRWLAIAAIGLRAISLVINFTVGQSLNFLEITSLRSIPLLGELVSYPVGVRNPWQALGQISAALLAVFLIDASVTAWRRGRRGAAVFIGGGLTAFLLAGVGNALLLFWFGREVPSLLGLFALGLVVAMAYALSIDLLRAKRLVVELGEREQEANLAADAASLGIWTRDVVRDTLSASTKWRELFGFSPDETISLQQVLERIHADDRDSFQEQLTRAARQRGDYQSEFRVVLPDGRLRWIAALGRVEFDINGRVQRSRGTCIDITVRKHADQEMLRLRQDLAHVARVSVIGQLSSTLAHEINQPLGAILRNVEAAALFMEHPSPDWAEIRAIHEDIRNDDLRAKAVIDRMRVLLRREEVAMTSLAVDQVLGEVAALLRQDAAARHVALEIDIPELPQVRGDRVQVQQVLLNLIINAMDALMNVGERRRSVAVTARRSGLDEVEISVADTGLGVAADQVDRIFDPFFTTKSNGIGMGLSISRSIVETHGGRLWGESNPAGGATFRFTMPIATPSP